MSIDFNKLDAVEFSTVDLRCNGSKVIARQSWKIFINFSIFFYIFIMEKIFSAKIKIPKTQICAVVLPFQRAIKLLYRGWLWGFIASFMRVTFPKKNENSYIFACQIRTKAKFNALLIVLIRAICVDLFRFEVDPFWQFFSIFRTFLFAKSETNTNLSTTRGLSNALPIVPIRAICVELFRFNFFPKMTNFRTFLLAKSHRL